MMFTAKKFEPKCKNCKGSGQIASGGGTVPNSGIYGCRIDPCSWCGGTGKRAESLITACDPLLKGALEEFKRKFG